MTAVARAEVEEALRRINSLAGFYEEMSGGIGPDQPGRLRTAGSATGGNRRTLQETVLVRSVSIVEALFQDLAERLLDERLSLPDGDPRVMTLVAHLRAHRMSRIGAGSWEELRTLWRDGLGVDLATFAEQSSLVALRTTRHAIVHRLGAVTDQYRKQHRQRLQALGIDPATATVIPLNDREVRDALELCRVTVRWLHASL